MPHAYVAGTGSATPKRILSNKELESIVDTSDEWITRRTGIKQRRIASRGDKETMTDLATRAAMKALDMAQIPSRELDMIVVGTVTPDQQFPSAACMVQKELENEQAMAFDVSAGCSGFLYALTVASNAIRVGTAKTALVIGAERLSTVVNWQDRNTCVLLGDGAGAAVMASTENGDGILSTHLKSNGKFWDLLYSAYGNPYTPSISDTLDTKPFHLKMDGPRLFKKAVGYLTSIVEEALRHNALSSRDIALVVPHQANMRIIQALADNLQIPMEKMYTNLQKYGNTSSASIPIALDEANRGGVMKHGDHILLATFGAGLTWGSAILKWSL
jgi:3-oxoacyl-[acyl-carrier-protein] synthase III